VRPARRLHALHELTVTPASAVQAQEERRWAFFITALTCSLAGQTMSLDLQSGTTARDAYGVASAIERYYCNFGLNHEHLAALVAGGLVVSGADQDGEVRIVELREHPFYVATLFVPQVASTPSQPHPLVQAFVRAALHSHGRGHATASKRD
jgi:CTP synthase (UTP-ammonia lyase)